MSVMNAKRIGYLRAAPAKGAAPVVSPSPAAKAMWRKLAKDGYMTTADQNAFTRSSAGERELEVFDRTLSEPCRAVLNGVKAGQSGAAAMKGMLACVHAGLVDFIEDGGIRYQLTEAGFRLADPIGETGYFTKSCNKVLVKGVYVGDKGEGMLTVERLEGESKGKEMSIPRDAFVLEADWAKYLEG